MEGIIKYNVDWDNSENISELEFKYINTYRKIAYQNKYVGIGEDKIGYGNISFRTKNNTEFVISGSATGGKPNLNIRDYSKVTFFDINMNYMRCVGGTTASSESLSHAAIYSANKDIQAVLHLHNSYLWHKYLNELPTTLSDAEYGTTKMAISISSIAVNQGETEGVIIMAGHENGVIVYSNKLEGVFNILLNI